MSCGNKIVSNCFKNCFKLFQIISTLTESDGWIIVQSCTLLCKLAHYCANLHIIVQTCTLLLTLFSPSNEDKKKVPFDMAIENGKLVQ